MVLLYLWERSFRASRSCRTPPVLIQEDGSSQNSKLGDCPEMELMRLANPIAPASLRRCDSPPLHDSQGTGSLLLGDRTIVVKPRRIPPVLFSFSTSNLICHPAKPSPWIVSLTSSSSCAKLCCTTNRRTSLNPLIQNSDRSALD